MNPLPEDNFIKTQNDNTNDKDPLQKENSSNKRMEEPLIDDTMEDPLKDQIDKKENINAELELTQKKSVIGFQTDLREYGKEEIVDLRPNNTQNDGDRFNRGFYIFFQYYWILIVTIVFCVSIFNFYTPQDKYSFAPLFWNLILCGCFKIIFNIVFFVYSRRFDSEMNMVYLNDSLFSLGFVSVFFGFYQYQMEAQGNFLYYLLPLIISSLFNVWANWDDKLIYSDSKGLKILETIQLGMFLNNLNENDFFSYSNESDFFYSTIFFLLGILYICIGILSAGCLITAFIGQNNRNMNLTLIGLSVVLGIFCLYIRYLCLVYEGLISLLKDKVLVKGGYKGNHLDLGLKSACIGLLITTVIILVIGTLAAILFWRIIRNSVKNNNVEKISIISFANEMKLAISKQSDTYYTEDKDYASKKVEVNDEKPECYICYDMPNEILVKPCGHSGLCKPCMMDYIKTNKKCPICKNNMDAFFVFYLDEEKGVHMTKEVIKLH